MVIVVALKLEEKKLFGSVTCFFFLKHVQYDKSAGFLISFANKSKISSGCSKIYLIFSTCHIKI